MEQGKIAVENIARNGFKNNADYNLVIVGAGPAGIAASLQAKKEGIKTITLEQDTLGGTVYTFPRQKIIMTSPMLLPLYGKVKLFETSKAELLNLWNEVILKNEIKIQQECKVIEISKGKEYFTLKTKCGQVITTETVLLALGRRGTPRKLGIPGEVSEKVAYRLLEPEDIEGKKIVVVGGGDSAIEAALMLCDENEVILSYRGDAFNRIKPGNSDRIVKAIAADDVKVLFNTNLTEIHPESVVIRNSETGEESIVANDLVYIFAGGELPTQFLKNAGIDISTKFGEVILKHK